MEDKEQKGYDIGDKIKRVLEDSDGVAKHVPAIDDVPNVEYDVSNIGSMCVLYDSDDNTVSLKQLLDVIPEGSTQKAMRYAWLIIATSFVHSHPQYMQELRAIAMNDESNGLRRKSSELAPSKRDLNNCPSDKSSRETFDRYIAFYKEAETKDTEKTNQTMESVLQGILDGNGVVSTLTREIFEEMQLTDNVEQKLNDKSSMDKLFSDMLDKVNSKMLPKLANSEISQDALLDECRGLLSKFNSVMPMPQGAPDLVMLMNGLFGAGKETRRSKKNSKSSKMTKSSINTKN